MTLTKQLSTITSVYNKMSIWGKILTLTMLFIVVIVLFKGFKRSPFREGFEQQDKFLFKTNADIYDDFYANIYDYLVFNNMKDEYEIGQIINSTSPNSQSVILDIGSGTGHHVADLASKGFDVIGIDTSPSMVKKAQEQYPDYKFEVANALDGEKFVSDSFTHIMCMYFTVYYFKDKTVFFNNAMKWLKPGGYLIVHLVDRTRFDPILPPGNPLMYVSPQKYAKERITNTKVKFNDFAYTADFKLDEKNNEAKFIEKFKNDSDGKVRKHELTMYMTDMDDIVNEAQMSGFILHQKIDLVQCQYEYQYLYVFTKPN
jgi:SAM-dependent methyltransferase